MDATFNQDNNSWYFRQGPHMPIFTQIDLGDRHVILDVDPYGAITGIRVE
jgi:hypothetical protein